LQGKYNLVSVLVAVVAGLAIGFVATTFLYSRNFLRLPGEGPLQRLDRVLQLTPAERMQIGQVMEDTRGKMQDERRDSQQRRRKLVFEAYTRIRAILTPEQRPAFDRYFIPPDFQHSIEWPGSGEGPPPPERGGPPPPPGGP
jgi:hypothetical protein